MKVIIYDDKESTNQFLYFIQLMPLEISVDVVHNGEDFLNMYKKHSYDVLFLNTNDISGQQLKKEVIKENRFTRIVSINNSLECNDPLGCEYCKTNTNTYRVFKPFTMEALFKSLKDVKCDTDYSDGTLRTKLYILEKAIQDFYFDEDTYRYKIKSSKRNDIFEHIPSLVYLVDMFNKHNIKYVVEESYIQILKEQYYSTTK